MQLLTQNLPSGNHYSFESINLTPLKFGQILEYLENIPKNSVEKYYFDYCLLKTVDPIIDNLLIIDYEYCLYMLKALTISDNLTYNTSTVCPKCGTTLRYKVSLAGIEFNKMDPEALSGFQVKFANSFMTVRMPTISEFMDLFKKYRLYKKQSDMRIIKLISLFEQSTIYQQKVEDLVINATYKDIGVLMMLDNIYFNFIKPFSAVCHQCAKMYNPTESDLYNIKEEFGLKQDEEIPEEYIDLIKSRKGGVEIRLESLVSDFFRDVADNNWVTAEEILPRQIRKDS